MISWWFSCFALLWEVEWVECDGRIRWTGLIGRVSSMKMLLGSFGGDGFSVGVVVGDGSG